MEKILITKGNGRLAWTTAGISNGLYLAKANGSDLIIHVPTMKLEGSDFEHVFPKRNARKFYNSKCGRTEYIDGIKVTVCSDKTLPGCFNGKVVVSLWPHPSSLEIYEKTNSQPRFLLGVPNDSGELDEWGREAHIY